MTFLFKLNEFDIIIQQSTPIQARDSLLLKEIQIKPSQIMNKL